MDKIEYRELIKSIKNRYLKKDYEGVIDLSDQLELERIREVSILEIVAKSYEALGRCDLAREALLIAYKRMPSGKRIAYNLAMLCIKLDDLDSAVMFYEDFCKIAPRDNQRLILKYEIGKAGGVPIKDLVRALEVYNPVRWMTNGNMSWPDYITRWVTAKNARQPVIRLYSGMQMVNMRRRLCSLRTCIRH